MGVLMGYAGLCALWIPLSAWMMPNAPFRVGQVYLLTKKWRFEVRQRSGAERGCAEDVGGVWKTSGRGWAHWCTLSDGDRTLGRVVVQAPIGGVVTIITPSGNCCQSRSPTIPGPSSPCMSPASLDSATIVLPAGADLEIHYRRTTSLQDFVAAGGGAAAAAKSRASDSPPIVELVSPPPSGRGTAQSALIPAAVPDSSNPFWAEEEERVGSLNGDGRAAAGWGAFADSPALQANGVPLANGTGAGLPGQHAGADVAAGGGPSPGAVLGGGQGPAGRPALVTDPAGLAAPDGNWGPPSADPLTDPSPLPHGVVWGPLVFEARRFVELRKLSFFGATVFRRAPGWAIDTGEWGVWDVRVRKLCSDAGPRTVSIVGVAVASSS